jgi:hypothetical protein
MLSSEGGYVIDKWISLAYSEKWNAPPAPRSQLGEVVDFIHRYKPAGVIVEGLQYTLRTADIDVLDCPTFQTHEGGRIPRDPLEIIIPQCHDEVSRLDTSAPPLHIDQSIEMLRQDNHSH